MDLEIDSQKDIKELAQATLLYIEGFKDDVMVIRPNFSQQRRMSQHVSASRHALDKEWLYTRSLREVDVLWTNGKTLTLMQCFMHRVWSPVQIRTGTSAVT